MAIARVVAALAVLAGCGTAPPRNSTPCEIQGYASQACQVYQYSIAGG